MIQVDREISDSVVLSRRTFEMRLGAAAESIDGDFVGAECVAAAIEIADLDLDWPGVRAGIVQITFDRHVVTASNQAASRDFDRLDSEQGEQYVRAETERGEQDDDCALAHRV